MVGILKNEKGLVLPIGLMLLAIMVILSTTAVVVTTTDLKIGTNFKYSVQSLYYAEAGINEALHRMDLMYSDSDFIGEVPGTTPTPSWNRNIIVSSSAVLPNVATVQPIDGNELHYSVDIRYKIEDAQFNNGVDDNEVVLYGQDFGYGTDAPVTGTYPVKTVTSTGITGSGSKIISVEVARFPINISATSALAADSNPLLGGSTFFSGLNHDVSTTSADSAKSTIDIDGNILTLRGNGIDNHGGKERHAVSGNVNDSDILLAPGENEDTADTNPRLDEVDIPYGAKIKGDSSTYLPGVWTTGDVVFQSGTDDVYGGNSNILDIPHNSWKDEDGSNAWKPLYELLGLTSAELQTMLDQADVTIADTTLSGGNLKLNVAPEGITYIDNVPGGPQVKFSTAVNGWGLMYIKGDLKANNLNFKGLIFVEGQVELGAQSWLLGAMAVKGGNPGASGGGTILYSKDALDQSAGNAMKHFVLGWFDQGLAL